VQGSAVLTVTAAVLTSISVTPATASVAAGYTQQFTATGTYSNGSTQNLTSSVTWTSSATGIATINRGGLASSVTPGSATITASSGSITGSATLTVTTAVLTAIAVTPATASVAAGYTQQFTATGTYSNGSTRNLTSTAQWASSATGVVTVNSAGLATSVAPGTATITAQSGAITGSAILTVTAAVLTSISVTPATASVAAGYTQQFTATGTYSNGSTQNLTSSVTWTASATSVATVSRSGLATTIAPGTAAITAQSGAITGSATLTVTAAVLTSISVTPATPSVAAGYSRQFTATGTYSNGSTQNLTSSVQWTSSATGVATINSGGLASSVAPGSATITATSGSISGSATFIVTTAVLTAISITPATSSVAAGYTQQFTATGTYSNGSTQNLTSSVTWTSSATGVATVNSGGLASSVTPGTAAITATSGSITGSATLTVTTAALTAISITPATSSVAAGYTQQFTATGTYSNGSTQNLAGSVGWTSSTTTVARISSGGLASTLAAGTTTITARSGPITGSVTLTVTAPVLTSLSVIPATASIAAGYTQQFTATGTYSNGSTQNLTSTTQWTSSATTVAAINSGGLATSLAQGTATITATSGTISGSVTLKVKPAVLVSISVTPATASVAAGSVQQFAATGTFSNGSTQNLTSTVQWSSSATTVAAVNSRGLATSVAAGTVVITATSGTISGSAGLTVMPVLTSLSVSPATASTAIGISQQFTAIGNYSDGSTQDMTGSVNWSSSSSAATLSGSGLATGESVGTSTITATWGSITASATLNVGPPVLVSMAVTPANASFALGTTQALIATGTYSDGSTLDLTNQASWSTANGSIATVSAQGLATSVAVGSTGVSATSGAISGSTALTITPALLVSIAVTPAIPTIPLGTTQAFTATGTYTDGSTQNITGTAQWSSDTPTVATIGNATGSRGVASSVGEGSATITASVGSITASTILSVTAAVLESIAVTPATPTLPLGTQQQFTATGTFTDGSTQDFTSTATWSSDTPATATINAAGLAQSAGMGTATITATSGSISGSTELTVTAAAVVSITITPPASTIPLGMPQQFTAMGTFTDGSTQDVTQTGHWSSTAATVATISNTASSAGLASTLGTGTTTVAISENGASAAATLTVNPAALVSIAITPQAPAIALGTSQQFTATGTYTDGSTQDVSSIVTWNSSDATVAIISNVQGSYGLATSAGQGSATITATSGSITSSTTITVGPAALASIAVTPSSVSLALGYSEQFTAIATYTDNSTQDITQSATWTSSVPTVAAVNSTGLAVSELVGITNMLASSGSVTGSGSLMVIPPVPVSLVISPVNPSIFVSAQEQFGATLYYSDGSSMNVTSSVVWSSSNPGVASVSSSGSAVGGAGGSSMIAASWGSNLLTASTGLTVLPPTVSIAPAPASIAPGATQQFSATVVGSTNQNVTWSVDGIAGGNSSLGTISSTGLYSAPQMIGSHNIAAVAQVDSASQGTATVTVGSPGPVPGTFFGMHLLSLTSPIPGTMAGTGRIWDSASAQWPNLNTASNTFVWTNLDAVLAAYQTAGIHDVFYTLWRVPNWASSNKTDTSCDFAGQGASSEGECDLPTDINPDGSGTNLTWRTWVQNIAQHVNSPGYSATHAHIGYWEACNECFRSPTLYPGYSSSSDQVAYKGTYAQLVRLMQDARCIILGHPKDPITALNTTCGQAGYPVTGIDPTAQMVMPSTGPLTTTGGKTSPYVQAMQNLLYCTCSGKSCSASSTGCPTGSAGSAAVDIINAHIYPKPDTPEQIPTEVASVRSALQASDLAKPFWNGEGGWGITSHNPEVDEGDPDLEAAFIARFQIMAWASGLARSYWYEWDNSTHGALWNSTSIKGCTTPFGSGDTCEAGIANQQVYDWMVGSTLTGCSANGTTWTCGLIQSSGTQAEIVWDTSQTCTSGICGTLSYFAPPIYSSYSDLTGANYPINGAVPIGIKPILLEVQ
jgi:uncharacterized protein YjdB